MLKVIPEAGSYVAESDFFHPAWQQAFWGPNYPRLDPPLHIGFDRLDKLGGKSAALFILATDSAASKLWILARILPLTLQ